MLAPSPGSDVLGQVLRQNTDLVDRPVRDGDDQVIHLVIPVRQAQSVQAEERDGAGQGQPLVPSTRAWCFASECRRAAAFSISRG